MSDKNEEILGLLSEYKWGESFTCRKCGNQEYKKGKLPYSRRCKNKECDYDESVLKFTAFEGLKLEPVKIYGIIEHLVDSCKIDHSEKTIQIEKRKKPSDSDNIESAYNVGDSLSVNDLVKKYVDGEVSPERAERLFSNNLNAHKINVSEIAREFETEENTIYKILERFEGRLALIDPQDWGQPADHVFAILAEGHHDLNYYLGLLMFPMDVSWENGIKTVGDKKYSIKAPNKFHNPTGVVRWGIVELG